MRYSKDFLTKLDLQHNRTVYARITALTMDERPMETVEGKATSGTINLDGSSAVRRTCSLSLVTNDINISNYLWSLNTKFRLEIGLHNYIDDFYPEIIWFDQGIYLITSFSTALAANSFTINIQGKDKMCRLNGEIGGMFQSSVDFGKMEEIDSKGNRTFVQQQLKDIIRDMIHTYGGEPYENIIINDLDTTGLMLEEYVGEEPLFLVRKAIDEKGNDIANTGEYQYAYTNGHEKFCRYWGIISTDDNGIKQEGYVVSSLNNLPIYESLVKTLKSPYENPTEFQFVDSPETQNIDPTGQWWTAAKVERGQAAGYSETELTYAGDLVANAGETIVSVLDKIKNMLGDFEYFYNLDGQFVFQRNKNYINVAWTPDIVWGTATKDGEIVDDYAVESIADASATAYSFLGNELLVSFNNTPNLQNLKNDYSIWGNRTSASGGTVPIHLRYAIDKKPTSYTSIYVSDSDLISYNNKFGLNALGQNSITYVTYEPTTFHYDNSIKQLTIGASIIDGQDKDDDNIPNGAVQINMNYEDLGENVITLDTYTQLNDDPSVIQCDWRELIYRMALDYRKYGHLDDFQLKVAEANPIEYPTGITGYEQYYIDLEGFWRQLYSLEDVYTEVPFSLFSNYYNNEKRLRELEKLEEELDDLKSKVEYLTDEQLVRYQTLLAQDSKRTNEKQRLEKQQVKNLEILNRIQKLKVDYNKIEESQLSDGSLNGKEVYYLVQDGQVLPYHERARLKSEDSNENRAYANQNNDELNVDLFTKAELYTNSSYQTEMYMFENIHFDNWYEIKKFGTKFDIQTTDEKYYTIKALPSGSIGGYNIKTVEGRNFNANNPIDDAYQIKQALNGNSLSFEIFQVVNLNDIEDNELLFTKKEIDFYDLIPFGEYKNQSQQPYYSITSLNTENATLYPKQTYYAHRDNYVTTILKEDVSNEDIFCEAPYEIIHDNNGNPIAKCALGIDIKLEALDQKIKTVQTAIDELLATHFQDEEREARKGLFKLDTLALEDLLDIAKKLVLIYKYNGVLSERPEGYETKEFTDESAFAEGEPQLSYKRLEDLKAFVEQYLEKMNESMEEYEEAFENLYEIKYDDTMPIETFYSTYETLNTVLKTNINSKLQSLWMPKDITYDITGTKEDNLQVAATEYFTGLVAYYYENLYNSCNTYLSQINIDITLKKNGWGSHSLISFVKRTINKINNQRTYLEQIKKYVYENSFVPRPFYKKVNSEDIDKVKNVFYLTEEKLYYKDNNFDEVGPWANWNRQVYQTPDTLNFWFDFLDSTGEVENFSARTVGVRPIVKNDNDTKSIYQKTVPLVIYHDNQQIKNHSGYSYIDINEIQQPDFEMLKQEYEIIENQGVLTAVKQNSNSEPMPLEYIEEGVILWSENPLIDPIDGKSYKTWRYSSWRVLGLERWGWRGFEYNLKSKLFASSAQGKTAKNVLDELLYQHSYCTESVSISAVPVYHLEPNTRIYVFDANTGIEGEYLLSKITIPLSYNGQMTMSATKAVSRLL